MLLCLGVVGVLGQGLFGLLLQFVLLVGQSFGLLGQSIQLGNPRLRSCNRVLLILLSRRSHRFLSGSGFEGFGQIGESLRSLLLLLGRLLHRLLKFRSRGGWFGRARRGLRLLLGELLDLLLSLGRFGESLRGRLLLGLRSDWSSQVGQFLLPLAKIVRRLIGLLRRRSLRLGGGLLSSLGTGLLLLRQGLSGLVRSLLLRIQRGGEVVEGLLTVGQSLLGFGELGGCRIGGGSVQCIASLISCGLGSLSQCGGDRGFHLLQRLSQLVLLVLLLLHLTLSLIARVVRLVGGFRDFFLLGSGLCEGFGSCGLVFKLFAQIGESLLGLSL